MNALHLTVAAPGDDPAVLTVPQPLTAERLTQLEQAIAGALGTLRRELCGRASAAGDIEYASWPAALRSSRP